MTAHRTVKVLFAYKFLTIGGVETVLRARTAGLDPLGVEAHAWFFHDLGGASTFAGVEERVRIGDPASCVEAAEREGFDLLCSIDSEEVFTPFAAVRRRARLLVECHSPYVENLEYLRGLAAFAPAAVLVPSQHQREVVRARLGDAVEVRVVPNPLRDELVAEPLPFPAPPPRPVVAWIGRMDELKNWRGFLEVAGHLQRVRGEVEFWMAGRPVSEDGAADLWREAVRAGVAGRLRWLRDLPHHRIAAMLDAVRTSGGVVVSTSRGESFGMTVAEAMARRCAVLVPADPPLTELVEDGRTGLCYRRDDVRGAAALAERLLADEALRSRLGDAARESALGRFAPAVALPRLAGELRRLLPS